MSRIRERYCPARIDSDHKQVRYPLHSCPRRSREGARQPAAEPTQDAANHDGSPAIDDHSHARRSWSATIPGHLDPLGRAATSAPTLAGTTMPMVARICRPVRPVTPVGLGQDPALGLETEPRSRKEADPLCGWLGSEDTEQQIQLLFPTQEAAGPRRRDHRTPPAASSSLSRCRSPTTDRPPPERHEFVRQHEEAKAAIVADHARKGAVCRVFGHKVARHMPRHP